MTSSILRSTMAAIAFAGALALATPSMAAVVNFKAALNGKSEVPANTTAGTGEVDRELRHRDQETDLERQL